MTHRSNKPTQQPKLTFVCVQLPHPTTPNTQAGHPGSPCSSPCIGLMATADINEAEPVVFMFPTPCRACQQSWLCGLVWPYTQCRNASVLFGPNCPTAPNTHMRQPMQRTHDHRLMMTDADNMRSHQFRSLRLRLRCHCVTGSPGPPLTAESGASMRCPCCVCFVFACGLHVWFGNVGCLGLWFVVCVFESPGSPCAPTNQLAPGPCLLLCFIWCGVGLVIVTRPCWGPCRAPCFKWSFGGPPSFVNYCKSANADD